MIQAKERPSFLVEPAAQEQAEIKKPPHQNAVNVKAPYPVSANKIWRRAGNKTILSDEARMWKELVQSQLKRAGMRPFLGSVGVNITIHPKLTRTCQKSSRLIDLDNGNKLALDSLQGAAFKNDNQIVRLSSQYGQPIDGGGMQIYVYEVEDLI